MRSRRFAMLAVLVGLGLASSLLTSQVIAQRKPGGGTSGPTQAVTSMRGLMTKSHHVPGQAGKGIPVIPNAHFTFGKMTATPADGQVTIDGEVTLQDSRGPTPFIWAVLVHDQDGSVLSEQDYRDQVFSIQSKEPINPTFHDVIPLQPGIYEVELRLYQFSYRPGVPMFNELGGLNPEDWISSGARVTIP